MMLFKLSLTLSLLLCQTTGFAPAQSLQTKHASFQPPALELQNKNRESSFDSRSRRSILSVAPAWFFLRLLKPRQVMAASGLDSDKFRFQIKTSLPKGFKAEDLGPKSALMITVKPAVTYTSQVPKDIADASLAATGHWVPIVLRSNQLCSDLQLCDTVTTTLTANDVTPEAGTSVDWWKGMPLIVTAKLDADGQGSTVDSSDLVGCKILPNAFGLNSGIKQVILPLQKRGLCADMLPNSNQS